MLWVVVCIFLFLSLSLKLMIFDFFQYWWVGVEFFWSARFFVVAVVVVVVVFVVVVHDLLTVSLSLYLNFFLMVVMGVWGWETNSLIFLPLSSNVIEKFRLQLFVVNFEGDDFSFLSPWEMMMDLSSLSFPLYLTHVCFFCNIATIYI